MANENIKFVLQGVNNTQKAFNDIKRNLNVLDRKTKGLQKSFAFVAKSATVAFTAISVAVGVSTARIDKLVKTSQKLGIGVEFLQKFRFAAQQVGIRTETADMALQRFSRRVAEARKGTGEAKDTLTQLGIALFESSGEARDIEDVLFDVADAMSKTTDASEMVRQSFKFFDSEGVALVALMKNGSEAMKEFFDDAENLGAVLSTASAQGVADFADEMTRLRTLVGGLSDNFTAGLAPALETITNSFIKTVQEEVKARGGFEKFGNFLANEFLGIIQMIIIAFTSLANITVDVLNTIRGAGLALGLIEETENLKKFRQEVETLEANLFKKGDDKALTAQIIRDRKQLLELKKEELEGLLKEEKIGKLNAADLLVEIDKIRKNLQENPINLFPSSDTGDDADAEGGVVKPAFIRNLELGIENFAKDTNDLMSKSFTDAFKTAEDALLDFVMTGKGGFKDLVNSLVRDLARIQIRKGMLNLFGSFGLELPEFDGGGFTGMSARAGGIDGKGGFPAILHPNETVIDHTKPSAVGGIVINQSVNFATGVQDTVKNEVLQLLPDIAETSKGAVLEAMSRGGNFRRGMR